MIKIFEFVMVNKCLLIRSIRFKNASFVFNVDVGSNPSIKSGLFLSADNHLILSRVMSFRSQPFLIIHPLIGKITG